MTQENECLEGAAAQVSHESMPPYAGGLSIGQVQALIAREHAAGIDKNDPLLMIVTVLNAYLGEVQKLHERHSKGLAKLMAEKTDGYVQGVRAATDALAEKLSSASAEGLKEVFRQQDARLASFKNSLIWLAAIVSASALLNVFVFVLRGLR
jgi:hypothetical protein